MIIDPVPYEEAAAVLADKPAVTRAVFDELVPELRARAFVISGVDAMDAVQAARDAIAEIPRGADWRAVKKQLEAGLEPWLGEGAEARAEMLMRWHAYQAYAAANVRELDENRDLFPYRQYVTAKDARVRDTHAALEGVTLPSDSPFWDRHTPPWEYGCRCDVRGVTEEEAGELRRADARRPEGQRRVLEGATKDELEQSGRLVREANQIFDVRTKSEKGESGPEWSPKDLRIPLEVLRERYDADLWQRLADWAAGIELEGAPGTGRFTLWDWMAGEAPGGGRLVQDRPASAVALMAEVMEGKAKWTRAEAATLFARLKARNPRPTSALIGSVSGAGAGPGLNTESLVGYVDDVARRVPRALAESLPPLEIRVVDKKVMPRPDLPEAERPKKWMGNYVGDGVLELNARYIASAEEARETAYHELMHWVQTAPGEEGRDYRRRMRAHFQARGGAGGTWADPAAGGIHPKEDPADPNGVEMPPVYFEKFANPERAASAMNEDPETMVEILSAFFQ